MKSLQAYISSIEPQLLRYITGKKAMLIRAVQEHNFVSEEALIEHICGKKRNRSYYYNLKSKTKKILQALAIVSNSKGESEVKKKLDLCRKNFAIGQKFLGKGERKEGLRLIRQAHRIAVEHDFVHMAAELSSVLYHHHVYYRRNLKMANFYANQVEKYSDEYRTEKKAEHYFYQVIVSRTLKSAKLKEAIEHVKILKGQSLKYKAYQTMLQVLYGLSIRDYQLIIENCEKVLKYFKSKRGVYISYYHFFLTNMGVAQIATRNYEKAENTFTKAQKYVHPKTVNERVLSLYKTINALHAGQYQIAYQLYRQNRNCRFEDIRQQFAIIQAYLCFLSHMGYLHMDGRFRLGKYLNETFKAQSDKQGSNITILIAELLVHLARDRGKFIDRVEAVNNYSYRHLKGEDTKRAKRFIKILCILPRANFNPVALRRIAARQIQYLEEHPIHMGENVAIEIIPFGDLLGMIMQQLEQKVA